MKILKSKNTIFISAKYLVQWKNTDINEIVASNKVSFGKKRFKYFVDYKDLKN